jgi:hypothetical protein
MDYCSSSACAKNILLLSSMAAIQLAATLLHRALVSNNMTVVKNRDLGDVVSIGSIGNNVDHCPNMDLKSRCAAAINNCND